MAQTESLVAALPKTLPLRRIAELDRQWFRLRPDRRYQGRIAQPAEREAFGARGDLIILIRHLGDGALVYKPVILTGPLPTDERELAELFARAPDDWRRIPTVDEAVSTLAPPAPQPMKLPTLGAFGLALAAWASILIGVVTAWRAW